MFSELLSEENGFGSAGMPCPYRYLACEGRTAVSQVGTRGDKTFLGAMTLCAAVIATLLVIGGVELNPGPVDNVVKVLCSGCDKN